MSQSLGMYFSIWCTVRIYFYFLIDSSYSGILLKIIYLNKLSYHIWCIICIKFSYSDYFWILFSTELSLISHQYHVYFIITNNILWYLVRQFPCHCSFLYTWTFILSYKVLNCLSCLFLNSNKNHATVMIMALYTWGRINFVIFHLIKKSSIYFHLFSFVYNP